MEAKLLSRFCPWVLRNQVFVLLNVENDRSAVAEETGPQDIIEAVCQPKHTTVNKYNLEKKPKKFSMHSIPAPRPVTLFRTEASPNHSHA